LLKKIRNENKPQSPYFNRGLNKIGKEDIFDPILGKKVKHTGKKILKKDLLEMLFLERNI
jgi:hypothetical protein